MADEAAPIGSEADFEKAVQNIAPRVDRGTRPVIATRESAARRPTSHNRNPFEEIAIANSELAKLHDRLTAIAVKLAGNPPDFEILPDENMAGGLLDAAAFAARIMRTRIRHLDAIAERIEGYIQ
jgi:hypothetical protein